MSAKKKILALAMSLAMILTLVPGGLFIATAVETSEYDTDFMMVYSNTTDSRYLTTPNSNAFNVDVYNVGFNTTFGDQHMNGIQLFMHGQRIATNGDIHKLPTPEQWDSTPAPGNGSPSKSFDAATTSITKNMTFNGSTTGNATYSYSLTATPEPGGVLLTAKLTADLPESLAGKVRFNLEFIPSRYESKTYQVDTSGTGSFDNFGTFPSHPQSTMENVKRADLDRQVWYVQQWNIQRGESQPVAFAKGYGFTLAPEDDLYSISITSETGELEMFDGRDRAQNGWYVLSDLIPSGKNGDVVAKWHIRPKIKKNWLREPDIKISQVGYIPNQEKFAVIELDKYQTDYPTTASLLKVNADGTKEAVYTADVSAPVNWQRFKNINFDFTSVTQTGMYVISYGGKESEIFPIAKTAYDDCWQSTMNGFLAVQMDHIAVYEGNRIWHGPAHMDDGSIVVKSSSTYFDGMSAPTSIPAAMTAKGITSDRPISGLNAGGWYDAGDFDLQGARETEVLEDLVLAAEGLDNLGGFDEETVTWDDFKTGGAVQMHKPDGVPDIVQQVAHGVKWMLAQYDALGGYGYTMEFRTLREYTHLGEASTTTDGYIYDNTLGENDIVERDGKIYSGKPDDRVLVGSMTVGNSLYSNSNKWFFNVAGAAYILYDYYPELATKCLNTALSIWQAVKGSSAAAEADFDNVVQLLLATSKVGNTGTYDYNYFKNSFNTLIAATPITSSNINNKFTALFLIPIMDEAYRTNVINALTTYVNTLTPASLTTNGYGVSISVSQSWGQVPSVYSGLQKQAIMYKYVPNQTIKTNILRAVNYVLGRHPVTSNSWISGVGTKTHTHPYNSNRADESFIPGSILPGFIGITNTDIVESLDDFSFLWFENESIISYQSQWIPVGYAASLIANETTTEEAAVTKDFTNTFVPSVKTLGSNDGYLQSPGFNLFMYNNTFDTVNGDAKNAGIELVQSGRRIATNGDISLRTVPERWDSLIAPVLNSRSVNSTANTLDASLTIPADSKGNAAVNYTMKAEPEAGGVKVTVKLANPLPADLVGKAGFSMQFTPAEFIAKSYQADANGDGTYDSFGVFQLVPSDPMESKERARTEDQPWYVKQWYATEGDKQPLPLATGKKVTLAAEDDDNRIRISTDTGDIAIYDGRSNTQDGWFVLSTMIPADATEIVWHISPDVDSDWIREPNIAHNQAGYAPNLSKVAVIELDPNFADPGVASLDRINADGTFTEVYSGNLGAAIPNARYIYKKFDFSSVTAPGMYVIRYAGVKTEPFKIASEVYDRTWQASLSGYLAIQMDHMRVREGYRIWHSESYVDDALQAPVNTPFFDGWNMGATDSTYADYQHIPGLDVGGWFDSADGDLESSVNIGVIQDLALAFDEFGVSYDTTMVDTAARFVELHRVDGINDVQQQVQQGIRQILGQIDNVGFVFKGLKTPTLTQYSMSGDASKNSDGRVYDSTMAADATYGLKSGKLDDRLAFVGTKDVALQFDAAAALASASYVLKGFDDALAARCLAAAQNIWDAETKVKTGSQGASEWNAAIQLLIATKGGEAYKAFLKEVSALQLNTANFAADGWKAVRVIKYMDSAFKTSFKTALTNYIPVLESQIAGTPFGVPANVGTEAILNMALSMSVLNKYFPTIVSNKYTLSAVDYMLGTHADNSTSWVSTVGNKSIDKAYGTNRADRFYISGGVVAGTEMVLPDLPEATDDYSLARNQVSYSLASTAKWVSVGYAASMMTKYLEVEVSPQLVTGFASSLIITVSGGEVGDKDVNVTLFKGDAKEKTLALKKGMNKIALAANEIPAVAVTTVFDVEASIAGTTLSKTAKVTVLAPTIGVWSPGLTSLEPETFKIFFAEKIAPAAGGYVLTFNGAPTAIAAAEEKTISFNGLASGGTDIAVISKVKYPKLFPKYSFTFTVSTANWMPPKLDDIKVSGVSLTDFAPDKVVYDYVVPFGDATPTVAVSYDNTTVAATITQASAVPGSATINVTSKTGVAINQYKVNFTRGANPSQLTANRGTPADYLDPNDPVWTGKQEITFNKRTTTNQSAAMQATGKAKILWDDTYLYARVEIIKNFPLNSENSSAHLKDSCELFFSENNYRGSYGSTVANGNQYRINYLGATSQKTANSGWGGSATILTGLPEGQYGYVLTYRIPWTATAAKTAGTVCGLDFQTNCMETSSVRTVFAWSDGTDSGYNSSNNWGELVLAN